MLNTCFHIGFPKSASTTLQKQLFNKHSDINFLGSYPTSNVGKDTQEMDTDTLFLKHEKLRNFHYDLTMLEGIEYEYVNIQKQFEMISDCFDQGKLNVFSNERFTSIFFAHKDRAEKAKRIHHFFPNSKIMIVLRKQENIIKSQYRDHPFDPRCLLGGKFVDIDKWVDIDHKDLNIGFLESINYYKLVKYYANLFGKKNVGIFLFEEMVNDLKSFSRKVSSFLGVDESLTFNLLDNKHENMAVSQNFNQYRKFKTTLSNMIPDGIKQNVMTKKIDASLSTIFKKGKSKKLVLNESTKELLHEIYDESNRQLEREYGVKLSKYGY